MKKILLSVLVIGSILVSSSLIVEAKTKSYSYAPIALCRDGTYSYSAHRQGTCSWHNGVRIWYR